MQAEPRSIKSPTWSLTPGLKNKFHLEVKVEAITKKHKGPPSVTELQDHKGDEVK